MNCTQTALAASRNRIFQPKLLAVAMATVVSQSAMAALSNGALAQLGTSQGLVEVARLDNNRALSGFNIAALPNDQFAVVWSEQENGVSGRVVMQRYSRFGETVGAPVVIYENLSAEGDKNRPLAVAADSTGKVVVGWPATCFGYNLGEVTAYTVEEGATPQKIDTLDRHAEQAEAGDSACSVDVAMDEDGDFAVSWGLQHSRWSFDPQVQTFNDLGQPLSSVIEVDQNGVTPPRLAMQADGSFMLVWSEDQTKPRVTGRRYADIGGTPAGDSFQVANFAEASNLGQVQPSLVADPQGGYIAVWGEHRKGSFSPEGLYREFDVRGQSWAADGSARSELFFGRVDEGDYEWATQSTDRPSVGADADGNLLAAWSFDRFSGNVEVMESHRHATVLNAQGQPLGDRNVAFGEVSDYFSVVNYTRGARVAVSDNAAALIWTEEAAYSESPRRLQAVFLSNFREVNSLTKPTANPSTNPPTNPPAKSSSSSGGGSLGWVTLLMAGLLAFGRRFRSFR